MADLREPPCIGSFRYRRNIETVGLDHHSEGSNRPLLNRLPNGVEDAFGPRQFCFDRAPDHEVKRNRSPKRRC